ncbi:MAG: 5'/3'-nucleotidase SurE [Myxococcales bacterium]|nr:5'/3'-nucleotidase SurE [Myxococcales bacterium]MDH3484377.1 5'/3'-nucleotidase SurE [Myxococcales bacterium]
MIYDVRRSIVCLALGLVLAVAGCGSSGDNGTGGTGGSAGTGGTGGSDVPLRILVTNDDGFAAEGINAIVEALIANPSNEIVVCAPDGNRSGSSDMTGPSATCGNLEVRTDTTASGYPATAIDGCPADAVNYALDNLYPANEPPDVVLSGINDGQNVGNVTINGQPGFLSQISGTIGAAKTAARRGVPALASSQGDGDPVDFPAGVAEVLLWLSEHRDALAEGSVSTTSIDSLNIPSCDRGSIRNPLEPLEVPLATENPNDFTLSGLQDCEAVGIDPDTDVNAFFTGWVTLSEVPAN